MLGERLGRIQSSQFTTGTGSSQPHGVVTASTLGKTAASATAITGDEILD
ncbi:MAG: phage major capsid protein, partial [Acidimicrobiia bacterium]